MLKEQNDKLWAQNMELLALNKDLVGKLFAKLDYASSLIQPMDNNDGVSSKDTRTQW